MTTTCSPAARARSGIERSRVLSLLVAGSAIAVGMVVATSPVAAAFLVAAMATFTIVAAVWLACPDRFASRLRFAGWALAAFLAGSALGSGGAADGSSASQALKLIPLALIVVALAATAARPRSESCAHESTRMEPLSVLIALYVGWLLVSSVTSPAPATALLRWLQMALPAVTVVLIARRGAISGSLVWATVLGAGANVALAFTLGTPHGAVSDRLGGLLHPNVLGFSAALALLAALWLVTRVRTSLRSLTFGCVLISVSVLVMTGSRTAILAALVGAPVLLMSSERHTRARASSTLQRLAIVGYVLLILSVVVFMPESARRVAERGTPREQQTLSQRTVLWNEAFARIKERPVFGWGPFVAGETGDRRALLSRVSQAHNALVESALVGGVPGALLWLALVSTILRVLLRLRGPNRRLYLGLFACVIVEGVGEGGPAWYGAAWLMLLALVAAALTRPAIAADPSAELRDLTVGAQRPESAPLSKWNGGS